MYKSQSQMPLSETVILLLFWGFSNEEVVLVFNKEGKRKTETGEFLKRAGWGGPAGKVEEGETLYEAAVRELGEETPFWARQPKESQELKEEVFPGNQEVQIFPDPIAWLRKGNHFKRLLIGRVMGQTASLSMKETDEILKCRRFSLKALPSGKAGIYEDHLELFQRARKALMAKGENMQIVAIDEKADGRVHPKDRPAERPFGRRDKRFGKKKWDERSRRDFRETGERREETEKPGQYKYE